MNPRTPTRDTNERHNRAQHAEKRRGNDATKTQLSQTSRNHPNTRLSTLPACPKSCPRCCVAPALSEVHGRSLPWSGTCSHSPSSVERQEKPAKASNDAQRCCSSLSWAHLAKQSAHHVRLNVELFTRVLGFVSQMCTAWLTGCLLRHSQGLVPGLAARTNRQKAHKPHMQRRQTENPTHRSLQTPLSTLCGAIMQGATGIT